MKSQLLSLASKENWTWAAKQAIAFVLGHFFRDLIGATSGLKKLGGSMKTFVDKKFAANDAGEVSLGMDGTKIKVELSYDIGQDVATLVGPIVDKAFDAVEKIIPGDWDKNLLDPERQAAKDALVKALSGI